MDDNWRWRISEPHSPSPQIPMQSSLYTSTARVSVLASLTFATCLLTGRGLIAQEFSADESQAKVMRSEPLKPLSEIRFDHHLAKGKNQVVPKMKTLTPTTLSHPAPEFKSVQWQASGLYYNRPYFEEYCLERHGESLGPVKQPIWSTTRFFVTAAAMPVLPLIWPPRDHIYLHDADRWDRMGGE